MTTLLVNLGQNSYNITVGAGLISHAGKYFNLNRRVAVITDSGVPAAYAKCVAEAAKEALIITVPEGEGSKSFETLAYVSGKLAEFGMTRTDCIVAVGGGVVGDLSGFAASIYMRGIDFYNIPTTLLSQVDSSIGGKTAVNHGGIKNIVGAFHQPRGVLIDTEVLKTLPKRQIANGLAEALKMAITFDKDLFERFESESFESGIPEDIIVGALEIKRRVVEEDEREGGIRKVLNFGHTFGHAIEAQEEMHGFYHGECVALGMTYMCSADVKARLIPLLSKLGLPTKYRGDASAALEFIMHDKKCDGEKINYIYADEIGSFKIKTTGIPEFCNMILEKHRG